MSMRAKLLDAARVAVLEERARCLWCADQIVAQLQAKLRGKLLGSAQLHNAELKLKIAKAVVNEVRRAIVGGARPPGEGGVTGQTGTADFSPPEGESHA